MQGFHYVLLVPGKYSYVLGQQPSWPYFQQIAYASPLRMRKDLSESSLFAKFTVPTSKAFLKACSQNVPGNKQ